MFPTHLPERWWLYWGGVVKEHIRTLPVVVTVEIVLSAFAFAWFLDNTGVLGLFLVVYGHYMVNIIHIYLKAEAKIPCTKGRACRW